MKEAKEQHAGHTFDRARSEMDRTRVRGMLGRQVCLAIQA